VRKERYIISLLFLCQCQLTQAQYSGGSNDGYANAGFSRQNKTDAAAFKGGNNDGYTTGIFVKLNTTDAGAFKGGNNDGFTATAFLKLNTKDSLAFKGGINDGFANALFVRFNIKDSLAFRGGGNDGFAVNGFSRINITVAVIYRGSIGRGETQVMVQRVICGQPGAPSVWNGSINNEWSRPGNWDCGNVPGINSVVIIPSAVSRYPIVFISTEIKSLQLLAGSSVTVPAGINLKLNGQ